MVNYSQKLIALLSCVALLLPSPALLACQCCTDGCPAKSVSPAGESCCKTKGCCKVEAAAHKNCCSSNCDSCQHDAGTSADCGSTCHCTHSNPPAAPLRNTTAEEVELQLDCLGTVGTAAVFLSNHDASAGRTVDSGDSIFSPLRLHALLGVWLN